MAAIPLKSFGETISKLNSIQMSLCVTIHSISRKERNEEATSPMVAILNFVSPFHANKVLLLGTMIGAAPHPQFTNIVYQNENLAFTSFILHS